MEKGNVIVVTINRLGMLGFFAHPAIDAENHPNANYGLMDQHGATSESGAYAEFQDYWDPRSVVPLATAETTAIQTAGDEHLRK